MMKINISIPIEDLDKLKLVNQRFDSSGDVLSGSQLVSLAVQMVRGQHIG